MKFFLIAAILIYGFADANARNTEKIVKEQIREVTVYLNGAQIESDGRISLEPGVTDVVFQDIPANINRQSIQVSGSGDFTILSVTSRPDFLKSPEKKQKITALEDSIEFYSKKLEVEQIRKFSLEQEEGLILSNKNIGGDKGVTAIDLEDMADLYRNRLTDVKTQLFMVNNTIKKLQDMLNRFKQQYNERGPNRMLNTTEIVVTVSANSKVNALLNLTYIAYNAGWQPVYDIRANRINSPVELSYKAQVYQSTGNDWEKVRLVLSTGNPSENGVKPDLEPWILSYYEPTMYKGSRSEAAPAAVGDVDFSGKAAGTTAGLTTKVEKQFSENFEISIPYSIPSDSKPSIVEIQSYNLQADYKYITTPKLDNYAYLVAEIKDWEELGLVSAPANIFFEGAFVGESYLNALSTEEFLKVSLGRDKGIFVKRDKVKDLTHERSAGNFKKISLAYEISIRNTKRDSISIIVEDQLPIVSDKGIEVKITDTQQAQYDPETGKLTWKLSIPSAETQTIRFSFEVKHPKEKIVPGL